MFANLCSAFATKAHHTARPRFSTRARFLRVESLEVRRLLALVPELVADISPGLDGTGFRSLTSMNGTLFFVAADGKHGEELWTSDGTAAGTQLVKDIWPGTYSSNPVDLINVNGTLFFGARDEEHGGGLWQSDGTNSGTQLVTDFGPGDYGGGPRDLVNVNGTLFLRARDDEHGFELWKSDGTTEGTHFVDIVPGPDPSYPRSLTDVNGTLFFEAWHPEYGRELWKSDGTEAGTILVRDIIAGAESSYPTGLTNVNGSLYFSADSPDYGREFWTSDGTHAGTQLLIDISPGPDWSVPSRYAGGSVDVNGTAYFAARDNEHGYELWKSDGSEAGTQLVRDINPGNNGAFDIGFGYSGPVFTNVNGVLFFGATDSEHGIELWTSDGTDAGTRLVRDINPGADASVGSIGGSFLTNVNGTLFFVAYDSEHAGLWKSDGTTDGTTLVRSGENLGQLKNVNGTLYFAADDGIHGRELWKLAPMPGDTNYDGVVDLTDLNNVRNNFGYVGDERPGDTTGDGVVNLDDLNAVRNHMGEEAAPVSRENPAARDVSISASKPPIPPATSKAAISSVAADMLFAVAWPPTHSISGTVTVHGPESGLRGIAADRVGWWRHGCDDHQLGRFAAGE